MVARILDNQARRGSNGTRAKPASKPRPRVCPEEAISAEVKDLEMKYLRLSDLRDLLPRRAAWTRDA